MSPVFPAAGAKPGRDRLDFFSYEHGHDSRRKRGKKLAGSFLSLSFFSFLSSSRALHHQHSPYLLSPLSFFQVRGAKRKSFIK